MKISEKDIARFMSKIEFETMSGCWLWACSTDKKGYGKFYLNGSQNNFAHRVSFVIHKGPLSNGKLVCHHCDNPSCVNPDHLFSGSYKDNHDDMRKKKRSRSHLITMCPRGHDYVGHNVYLTKNGHRVCRICKNKKSAEHYAKRKSNRVS